MPYDENYKYFDDAMDKPEKPSRLDVVACVLFAMDAVLALGLAWYVARYAFHVPWL
jgi:hypothetical protein